MTYCIGWKTGEDIIVAADAALTRDATDPLCEPKGNTSFSENNCLSGDGKIVQEQALKSYRISDSFILTYSGNGNLAHEVIGKIQKGVKGGEPPLDAVKQSLAATVDPYNTERRISLIFGFIEDGVPHLHSYNVSGLHEFTEHEFLVQAGSMPSVYKEMTQNHLDSCIQAEDTIKQKIIKLLATLQGYGRVIPTMASGVGGVYSTVGINIHGIQFQPDVLHIYNSNENAQNYTGVYFRHQCLVVITQNSEIRCFLNVKFDETSELVRVRANRAIREGLEQHFKGKFDFIILQNVKNPAIAVVEMNKKKNSELIRITTTAEIKAELIKSKCDLHLILNPRISIFNTQSISLGDFTIPIDYYAYERPISRVDLPIAGSLTV